jgi:hypothetical protein
VRLELTRGNSGGREWQVDASAAGARIEVGSDPTNTWAVRAPGVSGKHLEIYWDGEVLWVARIHGAPEVQVDGLMVDDWYATAKGSRIQFGQAELKVDAGGGGIDTAGVASRITERVDISNGYPEAKTSLATPASISGSQSLPDGPTQIMSTPEHEPHISAAATQIVRPAQADDAAGRIAAFEAQISSGPGLLPSGQATQLVAMPEARGEKRETSGARQPPPPRFGQNVHSVPRDTPPPAPPMPMPTPSSSVSVDPTLIPGSPEATGVTGATDSTPFATPPVFDPKAKKKRRKKEPGEKSTSLPIRTWVLLIATVGALLLVLFMDDDEDQGVPPPLDQTEQTTGGGVTPVPGPDAGPAAAPDAAVAVVATDGGATEVGDAGDLSPLARRAVDALVANRTMEAYELYGALAAQNPDEPTYRALRNILRRRLQASCRDGVDVQGNPCTQVE